MSALASCQSSDLAEAAKHRLEVWQNGERVLPSGLLRRCGSGGEDVRPWLGFGVRLGPCGPGAPPGSQCSPAFPSFFFR